MVDGLRLIKTYLLTYMSKEDSEQPCLVVLGFYGPVNPMRSSVCENCFNIEITWNILILLACRYILTRSDQ